MWSSVARSDEPRPAVATDPALGATLWAAIERDVVDLAPWVPLFTPGDAGLVSERAGNYQTNPELGLLLDQLWVR